MNTSIEKRKASRMNREIQVMRDCVDPYIWYKPVSENNLTWHFTVRGPTGSPFEGGLYHGRIELPTNYPFSPPDFYFITENGRYTINTKLCLSISSYHPESWTPSITLDKMLQMVQVFLEDYSEARIGIGFIMSSESTRRDLAKKSMSFICPQCGAINSLMRPLSE